ncbi:hypothetical protein LOTGIDRAFT_137905 [Lottia gigantea]|uniref:CAF1B/HIR1 beta-propeller domain-containing protein n=1 Tax=Lottia gigantea TaxID=225164 RepID=V4B6G7_LOTGI|nr:hypothetical protein LOTGIDRAFT_137905 [Lottia gigantea]ESP03126.1 hypothetical protein LOTGIDRAFT_137905 [Lottia gigantea]
MKVITPEISWHEREPIYSVDFQGGNHSIIRLATGGVDKTVRIWSVKVDNEGKGEIEFLSNLRRHTRAVNCCRFSPNGEMLATAGDDGVIILWKLSDTPTPSNNIFQEEDADNKETWVTHKMLRGHIEDVYDLSWSADGKYLVSGSVDNSAIVWDMTKETKLAIFNEHKSLVQGVAMDPLNDLVATLSTDRSCRIYNINSKNCIHNIFKMVAPNTPKPSDGENKDNKPKSFRIFHDDTMRSFFRRLTFTPDGSLLITPAGCVERGEKLINATHIFTRTSFNKPAVYLPSVEKATIAVRVCPTLFQLRKIGFKPVEGMFLRELPPITYLPYRMVFAVATEDSVLLYDTQQTTPIAYIGNIHYHQLSDLTWSSSGEMLVVSSTDGFCSIVTFKTGELGQIYVKETEKTIEDSIEKIPIKESIEKEKVCKVSSIKYVFYFKSSDFGSFY